MSANFVPGVVPIPRRPRSTAPEFRAEVHKHGINYAVDLPGSVSAWFGGGGPLAVLGLVSGIGVRATLVPIGGGRHRLFLNGAMREAIGVTSGDEVAVCLWRDERSRAPAIPDDVDRALRDTGMHAAFQALPPSHQREYLVTIEDAKQPETRARRIARTIEHLRARPETPGVP